MYTPNVDNFAEPLFWALALGCYEYLITIKYEANFLCRRKWSAATWLFLANRYMIVAMMIYQIAPYPPQVMLPVLLCESRLTYHFPIDVCCVLITIQDSSAQS